MGIVTKVFRNAELDDAAMNFARQLAKGPDAKRLKATKRLIRAAAEGRCFCCDRLVGLVGDPYGTHDAGWASM